MFLDLQFIISQLNLINTIDIALVFLLFYMVLKLMQGTKAVQLLQGILLLIVSALAMSNFLDLLALSWFLKNAVTALLFAIPVIFQPELRRTLERLGRTGYFISQARSTDELHDTLKTVVVAAQEISRQGHGALIVMERQTGLRDYIETGVKLDAFVTKFLLTTIFYDKTDLHDGAVIIQHNRIIAAGCLLPLSHTDVKENLGTRHRAGIGLTESTDAIVVIVSEENGIISVAHNGQITRRLDQSKLIKMLRTFYYHELKKPTTFFAQAKGKLGEMFHM